MRSVEDKLQHFPLATGMDQTGGERGSQPGTLSLARNCRMRGGGRLEKRCGSTAIYSTVGGSTRAPADTIAVPRPTERPAFLFTDGDRPIVGTSSGDYFEYQESVSTNFQFQGCFSAAQPLRRYTALALPNQLDGFRSDVPGSAATSDGFVLVASTAENSQGIWAAVFDPLGACIARYTVAPLTGSSIGPNVRCIAQGDDLIVLYRATANINYIRFTLTNGTAAVTTGTLLTLADAAYYWDTSSFDSGAWYIVHQATVNTVTVRAVSAVTLGATVTFSCTGLPPLSVWADPDGRNVWVGYLDDPNLMRFVVYSSTLSLVVVNTTIASGVGDVGPPLFGPLYKRQAGSTDAFFVNAADSDAVQYGYVVGGVVTGYATVARHLMPVGKPDAQQRVWCVTATDDPATEARFVLIRIPDDPATPSSVVEISTPAMPSLNLLHPTLAGFFANRQWNFQAPSTTGERTFVALQNCVAVLTNADGFDESQVQIAVYEYTSYNQSPHRDVASGGEPIIAGQPTSLVGRADAAGVPGFGGCEVGYVHPPVITSTTSGGVIPPNSMDAGTYIYQAFYQWVDSWGRRHVSAPSAPVTHVLAATGSVTVEVIDTNVGQRTPPLGLEAAGPVVVLYRTLAGAVNFQQLPDAQPPNSTGIVTFLDQTNDAELAENAFAYTDGGVLPNALAPACRYVRRAEERLWCGGLWDPEIVEASKVTVPGEPYCFTGHPSHQVVLPAPCTGLAYQDGQVVAFTADSIYLLGGDGPNDQGAGAFLPPRALVRGLGMRREDSASILETELGIIFRSRVGFYLIPRGFGTPEYIGAAVQNEDNHVLSAALCETATQRLARFLVSESDEDDQSQTVLTFDLLNRQWFKDDYNAGEQGFAEIGGWPSGFALMMADLDRDYNPCVIWYESEDVSGDAGASTVLPEGLSTYIEQEVEFAWLYPFGYGGQGKVKKLVVAAEPLGALQDLVLTASADEEEQVATWSVTDEIPVIYRGIDIARPLCTAFRVNILDQRPTGGADSRGFRLLSITTELESSGGVRMLTGTEKV